MNSRHPNLPTDAQNIQAAQARLTRVLESLSQRELEVEHLREHVYRLASQLYAAEALLKLCGKVIPLHYSMTHNSINNYFEQPWLIFAMLPIVGIMMIAKN